MPSFNLNYSINERNTCVQIKTAGVKKQEYNTLYTRDECRLNVDWEKDGYTIAPLFTQDEFNQVHNCIIEYVLNLILKIKHIDAKKFTLEKYHDFVNDEEHIKIIKNISAGTLGINGIPLSLLPFGYKKFDDVISKYCMKSYSTKKTFYKIFTSNHFWIRIVRPERSDNNPPHRDCYFNRNKRLINIYAPIAGSNENSSLPLVPGSHYWSEDVLTISKGKTSIGNVRFTNPAIVACKNEIKMITPNPKYGDCIVFTPYLIHGGGKNFNCDTTRVSLEMRFWPV